MIYIGVLLPLFFLGYHPAQRQEGTEGTAAMIGAPFSTLWLFNIAKMVHLCMIYLYLPIKNGDVP